MARINYLAPNTVFWPQNGYLALCSWAVHTYQEKHAVKKNDLGLALAEKKSSVKKKGAGAFSLEL